MAGYVGFPQIYAEYRDELYGAFHSLEQQHIIIGFLQIARVDEQVSLWEELP